MAPIGHATWVIPYVRFGKMDKGCSGRREQPVSSLPFGSSDFSIGAYATVEEPLKSFPSFPYASPL